MKFFARTLWLLTLPITAHAVVPSPPQLDAKSYIVYDFASQQVLADKNADERVEPASITKMMTAYVTFNELRQGHISMNDQVLISEKAWRMPGSRTFVEVGTKVKLEDLLHGMITQSGNDATVAIAEHIAGDESVFAELMNSTAKRLGMKSSHFVNATGLPAPDHYTTAHDIAILAHALIHDFPKDYELFDEKSFTFGQRQKITQQNRNLLLEMDNTADGIKTGHTESAGYCLAGSAIRDGRRLIAVVMGTTSTQDRARETKALLDYGFRFFKDIELFGADKPVKDVRVWKGEIDTVPVGVAEPISLSLPRDSADSLQIVPTIDTQPIAPVQVGQTLGSVTLSVGGKTLRTVPLVALQAVPQGGLMRRLVDTVQLWIKG